MGSLRGIIDVTDSGTKERLLNAATRADLHDHLGGWRGFAELSMVLIFSVTAIYLALLFQFKNAVKPLIVFAAIPYGMAGRSGSPCAYAQIGGLTVATFVTLLMVPVIYAIAALDLKIVD